MANEPASRTEALKRKAAEWASGILADPDFRKFNRDKIRYVLDFDDPIDPISRGVTEFRFPAEIDRQHDLVMTFMDLSQAQDSLAQCEYYFRRFPFRNLPVTKEQHARNICEMYFSQFYRIRSRLKLILNKLNSMYPDRKADVGALLKAFDRQFDQELRERNSVHHSASFDDVALDRLSLAGAMKIGTAESRNWEREEHAFYRKLSREWAARTRRRAAIASAFVNAVASAILERATFLDAPASLQPRK